MKHTAPAVSQFIIWKLPSYIIFFKWQLMFGRKGRYLLCGTFRCFNLIFYFSSLLFCLCPPCQLGSNSLLSCQPPAGVKHICYKMLTSTHSGAKHSAAFGYRFSPTRQPPIPHYAAFHTHDNHRHFHSTLDTHSWGFRAWILESDRGIGSKYDP